MFDESYTEKFQIPGSEITKTPTKLNNQILFTIQDGHLVFEFNEIIQTKNQPVTVEIFDYYGETKKLLFRDITNKSIFFERYNDGYRIKVKIPLPQLFTGDEYNSPDSLLARAAGTLDEYRLTPEQYLRLSLEKGKAVSEDYDPESDHYDADIIFNPSNKNYFVKIKTGGMTFVRELRKSNI